MARHAEREAAKQAELPFGQDSGHGWDAGGASNPARQAETRLDRIEGREPEAGRGRGENRRQEQRSGTSLFGNPVIATKIA